MRSFYWSQNPHETAIAMAKKPFGATAFISPSYYKIAKGRVYRWGSEWIRSSKSVEEITGYDVEGFKRGYVKRDK